MKYRFANYEKVPAYEVTTLEVEASSLDEAKEIILEYLGEGFDSTEKEEENDPVKIIDCDSLAFNVKGNPSFIRCLEDGSRTLCGRFVERM